MSSNGDKYRFFFENSADAMLIIENGEFVDCNHATVAMLGCEDKEGIINAPPFKLSPEFQPDGRPSIDKAAEMIAIAVAHGSHCFEWDHLKKDGTILPVEVTLTAIQTSEDIHIHTIWRDISVRRQAEKAKQDSEELFRHTFEANPDPVIIAKIEDGSIIDVNKAFEDATGILRADAFNQNAEQLELWSDIALRKLFLDKLQSEGEVTNFEADFKVRGGQVKTGLLSGRVIQVNSEPCMLLVIRDNTSEKAVKQAMVEMDQIKNDFISTAAHELKTPLTAIMGFTEVLLDPHSSKSLTQEKKRDFLELIYEKGEALHRLIKDLLDVTHINSGLPRPLNLQEENLTVLLRKAFDYYRLHETEYVFELILPEEPYNPTIIVDSKRICQILDNLLSNAVKYSPEGSNIVLQGKLTPDGWELIVKDHGFGMNQEQTSKVFDKFYRANPANHKIVGLGLGMSIVKQIVEDHKGTIHVESSLGTGTTITVALPCTAKQSAS
jgi:PAS domain S-box-containing protein